MSLFSMVYSMGKSLQGETFYLTFGRHLLIGWARKHGKKNNRPLKVLDIGCGQGDDLTNLKQILPEGSTFHGVEYNESYRQICAEHGIEAVGLNIEREPFPWEAATFDIIIVNQVLEHTKDTYFVLSEISRILRSGGILLIGVPNLAAWHDRLAILLGHQPTCIKIPGPHVRGFTLPALRGFTECENYFKVTGTGGSGFLPFPVPVAKLLASIFPTLATAIFVCCERTDKKGTFMEVLNNRFFDTYFFKG